MSERLTGKVAVVTGASRGVGREVSLALSENGASVALVARDRERLAETAKAIEESGGSALIVQADLSTPSGVDTIRKAVYENLGRVDILVNAAGVFGPIQLIQDSDPARWIETLSVNTVAPYLMCRAFMGGMVESGWGRIINVTSAAALHPPGPLNSAYGTSKVALNHFTRHLASELSGTGVTANVFHPGEVKTDMWAAIKAEAEQLGEEGDGYRAWVKMVEETGGDPPWKAAELVVKLVAQDSGNVTGQFLWIEEGLQTPIDSWETLEDSKAWHEE